MSTVLLCEDHRLVREALAQMLASLDWITHVHQAGSAEEALAQYTRLQSDVVLMDVRLPGMDGVAATEQLVAEHADCRVVLLTAEIREDERRRALLAGARGFLQKDIDAVGLATALAIVLDGGDLLSAQQRRALVLERPGPSLSARELEVVTGMAAGRSNVEIATSLWISEDTVKSHAKKLFAKIGVRDRAEAVAWAFRTGILY